MGALAAPGAGAGAAVGAGPLQLPVLHHFEHIVGVDDVLGGALGAGGALGREMRLLVAPGQRRPVHARVVLQLTSENK